MRSERAARSAIVAGLAGVAWLTGCATARTTCPLGTELARRIFSGGGEANIATAPTASARGAETRYYESGAEHVAGEYVDGTQSGVWRYRFNNGRNWRAERWDDGALVSKTIDPRSPHVARGARRAGADQLEHHQAGVARSAHWPRSARAPRRRLRRALRQRAAARRRRLRRRRPARRDWRFWYEDGHLAREIEYLAGVRERAAREWHPNGAPAVEGSTSRANVRAAGAGGTRRGQLQRGEVGRTGRRAAPASWSAHAGPRRRPNDRVMLRGDEALGDGADRRRQDTLSRPRRTIAGSSGGGVRRRQDSRRAEALAHAPTRRRSPC